MVASNVPPPNSGADVKKGGIALLIVTVALAIIWSTNTFSGLSISTRALLTAAILQTIQKMARGAILKNVLAKKKIV